MTLNSSSTFEFNIEEIVVGGMRRAGIMGLGQAQVGPQYEAALQAGMDDLEAVIDELQADGVMVRAVDRYQVTTADGTASYTLPSTSLDAFGWATYLPAGATEGETAVRQVTREEYMLIPSKASKGVPHLYYVERSTSVEVYVWPVPDEAGTLTFQRHKLLADNNDSTKTVDLERHWVNYLKWQLAHHFAMSSNRDLARVRHCEKQADKSKKIALRQSRQRPAAQMRVTHASGVYGRR